MAKQKTKPHAAANVAAIDATIAADLTGGVSPIAPTSGVTTVSPAVPSGPPLANFTQPLRPAVPVAAPTGEVRGSPPPSTPATVAPVGAAPQPRPAMQRPIDSPLFSDDSAVAIAPEPDEDVAQLRATLAEKEAEIASFKAALEATPLQIGELEHVDEPIASELRSRVIEPIVAAALKKQAAEYDKRMAKLESGFANAALTESQRAENSKKRAVAALNETIFQAHPDFNEISNSDGYLRAATQIIPLTTQSFGEAIKAAYKAGDATQFNKLVAHIKSNYMSTPTPTVVLGTGGVPDLSPVQENPAAPIITRTDMDAARTAFLQGRLSRAAYKEKVDQYEAQV